MTKDELLQQIEGIIHEKLPSAYKVGFIWSLLDDHFNEMHVEAKFRRDLSQVQRKEPK